MAQEFVDYVNSIRSHAAQLDYYLRRQHPFDQTGPASDYYSSGRLHHLSFNVGPRLMHGVVVDALPYTNWYRVHLEVMATPLPCALASLDSLAPIGSKKCATLIPGTQVLVAIHPDTTYGWILGSLPHPILGPGVFLGDRISSQSRCGIQVDDTHRFGFQLAQSGGIADWSNGRPVDSLCGETAYMAETGVGLFVDSFMAFLRGDEDCGLWVFFLDRLARLAGHNLQLRSAGWEIESIDDQGEVSTLEGHALYPWEARGAWSKDQTVHRDIADPVADPHYADREPKYDDQQPFYRSQGYRGFLGQGGRRLVALPPLLHENLDVQRYRDKIVLPGVFKEQIFAHGGYYLASAKSITLVKTPCISVPKMVARPESRTGDTPDNYRFSDAYGGGKPHQVRDRLEITGGQAPEQLQRAAGEHDRLAYLAEWEADNPFLEHQGDWFVPEPGESAYTLQTLNEKLDYTLLRHRDRLNPPEPMIRYVDHRYGKVVYYPNQASRSLAEDGSILDYDAYGASIRMSGGNVYIDAPRNIYLRSGGDVICLAGNDLNVRAHNAIDLSTTQENVRIRAAQELRLRGREGIYAHSGGPLTMRSDDDTVALWGQKVYIRSGVPGGTNDGIYLDSGKGDGIITMRAKSFERFIGSVAYDYFMPDTTITSTHIMTEDGLEVDGNLYSTGCLIVGADAIVKDWIVSAEGHIATYLGSNYDNLTADLGTDNKTSADNAITSVNDAATNAITTGTNSFTQEFDVCLYVPGQGGDDSDYDKAEFKFRPTEEYLGTDFADFEAPWQRIARITRQDLKAWKEQDESGTYPYPGKEALTVDKTYWTMDLNFAGPDGCPGPRDASALASPHYAAPRSHVWDGNYLILSELGVEPQTIY